jgi:hypothetical protein
MTRQSLLKIVAIGSLLIHAFLQQCGLAANLSYKPIDTGDPQSDRTASEILTVTNRILRKQTELERYYLQYRIRGSEEPKWRRLRYFFAQQLATLGYLSSNVLDISEFGRGLKNPSRENDHHLRYGYTAGLVGSIVGGSSDGLELASNALIAARHKKNGMDPASARKTVIDWLHEIDALAGKRDKLVKKLPPGQATNLLATEGLLLREYRDLCAYEFADAYSNIKSYQASSNVFYAFDMISEVLAATSWGLSIRGVQKTSLNGPAILAALIADSIALPSAPVSSLANYFLYKYWHAKFAKELGEKLGDTKKQTSSTLALLKNDVVGANSESLALLGPIDARLYAYAVWSTRYENFIDKEEKQLERLEKVARQYNTVGPAVALGNLGQDVLDTAGFYHFGHSAKTATRLYFAGSISSGAASLGSFTFTNYRLLDDYRFERQSKRLHEMPEQLLQTRLKTLDEMEDKLGLKEQTKIDGIP